ncbi:MAG: hypothetical protein M1823_005764 [Watsoniomyces obsoletus]|nr:MAG: hypothetical protein M1823_005764 [Watsoniomyces obsoletus]
MKVSVRARIALLGLLAGSAAAWPEDMHRRQELTWDPSYFLANSTITILLNYAEPDSNGKINQAWESPRLRNTYGFVAIPMDNNWLQDRSRNNLTLEIVAMDPMPGAQAIRRRGPTISLTKKPPNHPQPPPRVKTSKLGLYVGLPLALLAIVVILGAVCLGVRRTRRLGFANVMKGAGRRKGYGVGQSHRQRMRTAGGSKGIQLDDTHHHQRTPSDGTGDLHYADNDDGGFTDEPTHGVPVDSHNQGGQKNAFREEIERQRTGTK